MQPSSFPRGASSPSSSRTQTIHPCCSTGEHVTVELPLCLTSSGSNALLAAACSCVVSMLKLLNFDQQVVLRYCIEPTVASVLHCIKLFFLCDTIWAMRSFDLGCSCFKIEMPIRIHIKVCILLPRHHHDPLIAGTRIAFKLKYSILCKEMENCNWQTLTSSTVRAITASFCMQLSRAQLHPCVNSKIEQNSKKKSIFFF